MLLWEREIYVSLLLDYQEQKKYKETNSKIQGF